MSSEKKQEENWKTTVGFALQGMASTTIKPV